MNRSLFCQQYSDGQKSQITYNSIICSTFTSSVSIVTSSLNKMCAKTLFVMEPNYGSLYVIQCVLIIYNHLQPKCVSFSFNIYYFFSYRSSLTIYYSPNCIHLAHRTCSYSYSQIARSMGSTWGPPGDDRTQVGPMLAPWTLLYGLIWWHCRLDGSVWFNSTPLYTLSNFCLQYAFLCYSVIISCTTFLSALSRPLWW